MDFRIMERGYAEYLALIPGWGFLPAIFSRVCLCYNYVMPAEPVYGDISDYLCNFLRKKDIRAVSILGWSMGSYVAIDFCRKYPSMTNDLFLVSFRRRFPRKEIKDQLDSMERNFIDMLRRFYRRCFIGQREDYEWFIRDLEEAHLMGLDPTGLKAGLDYLSRGSVGAAGCIHPDRSIRFFYGARDLVAPLTPAPRHEDMDIIVINSSGHLPFLSPEFERVLIAS
ncbi:MAG: alpha/beta hydrolase [Desulfobacteraceae bacterium]|nr:alpha/beta hydrolase [Desulfobacteraceae bacterium]